MLCEVTGFEVLTVGVFLAFRDRVHRPSVGNFVSIFLQNIAFSLRITRLQNVVNTVLQCNGKAIPVQVYYRLRGLPDFKTTGI